MRYQERFVSCISSYIAFGVILCGVGVWCIIDISAGHGLRLVLVFRSRDIYWYRIDIDNCMLVQVKTMCFLWETMPPDRISRLWWTHDIASYASPGISCVVLRRFVVPAIAQNCTWFCSLFEAIWLLSLLPIRCCLSFYWVVYSERNMIYGNGLNVCLKMWYILCSSDGLCPSRF